MATALGLGLGLPRAQTAESSAPTAPLYLRPDGTSLYNRPDGTSVYNRP